MECIIKSRTDLNLKGKPFTYRFYQIRSEYIFLEVGDNLHRSQICEGGNYSGPTLYYSGDDIKEFKKICRKWYRQYRKQR